MTATNLLSEIKDANLGYLMLAQQMVRADKSMAIFRMGISAEIADVLSGLSNAQILKLANTNIMLARFRFDEANILGILTNNNQSVALSSAHVSILASAQDVERIL